MSNQDTPDSKTPDRGPNYTPIIVAIIGLIGTIATVYFTSTKPSDLEISIRATQTVEAKLTQSAVSAPPQTSVPLTEPPTLTPTAGNYWSGALQARLPTDEEMSQGTLSNLWLANSIKVDDLRTPETITYYGTAEKDKEYLLPLYWCAKSQPVNTINKNLASITFEFSVNGEVIPEQYIRSYNYVPDTNWNCNSHAVIIGGWSQNTQYVFEIKRTLSQKLNDGQSYYAAGEYIYKLVIDTK